MHTSPYANTNPTKKCLSKHTKTAFSQISAYPVTESYKQKINIACHQITAITSTPNLPNDGNHVSSPFPTCMLTIMQKRLSHCFKQACHARNTYNFYTRSPGVSSKVTSPWEGHSHHKDSGDTESGTERHFTSQDSIHCFLKSSAF